MNNKIIDFTIGADPEFSCSFGKHTIESGKYLDADDNTLDFGSDGNCVTFELRPAPSKNPLQIVNNIHDIFVRQVIKSPEFLKFDWRAGSWHNGYPLGGHVHFGLSKKQVNYGDAVNTLDNYVGLICLLIEKKADAFIRRNNVNNNYGMMGDMREQPWGFEYRPMSSWLSSPYIAAAMLCLSKTVMYEMMNNSNFDWHKFALRSDYQAVDQYRIRSIFPKIWKDITSMYLYQTYKPYLDVIYFLVSNKLTWLPKSEMKECWSIRNMEKCISTKVNADLIWNRFNNE